MDHILLLDSFYLNARSSVKNALITYFSPVTTSIYKETNARNNRWTV